MERLFDCHRFRPALTKTDATRIAAMTEAEIEHHATSDPDHPALDDDFWASIDAAGSLQFDADVHATSRRGGDEDHRRADETMRNATRGRAD